MTIYQEVSHAISRIMNIDCIDSTTKAKWQSEYQSGWPELRAKGSGLSPAELLVQDCMTRAALHRALSPLQWHMLVAKYSANRADAAASITWLATRIESPAHNYFKLKCVSAWAMPKVRGLYGSTARAAGLPDAFYSISTWDHDGRPEGTLRRWRVITKKWLEDRLTESLAAAAIVLSDGGLVD